jgi:predicted RNA-binding Zn-ribbon protein involved in translation (DUF1610 family)
MLKHTGPAPADVRIACTDCGRVRYAGPTEVKRLATPYRCRGCSVRARDGGKFVRKPANNP